MLRPSEEIYFWSGIMRDHAEFMLTTLSSREPEFIDTAQRFKNAFMALREEAGQMVSGGNPGDAELIKRGTDLLTAFMNFKRLVLRMLLQCKIEIGLPPTFINHMINEALEFYRTLNMMTVPKTPLDAALENLRLHQVWLADASGHAASIASDLDPVETMLIKEAEMFRKAFDEYLIKANELRTMLERACLDDGALSYFNKEVEKKIREFICFLEKIRYLREKCKVLGVIKPLIPDHMIREEKYYLARVHAVSHKA